MPTAASLKIAKTWKQSKCLSKDEWIKKMWYMYIYIYIHMLYAHIYTHNGILCSLKRESCLAIYDNMDGPWEY